MKQVRGRFEIVVPFEGGGSIRFTSDKTRSLKAVEIAARLREYADIIERGDISQAPDQEPGT